MALSKTKCNTFCRKVPPAKIYQHLATQERTVVTTCAPSGPLPNVFAARAARWAAKSPRADPGHAEHSYSPSRDEDRLVPGQWKGDLIKGAGKRSSADTLVERTTGFAALAATTMTVVDSFAAVLNGEPAAMRKMMACDQGSEMHGAQNFH